jgi:hypothetical protein
MSQIIATTLSNGSVSVPTATVVNGSAKAWVNFNGTGTIAARDSFNVASLTDLGTGTYRVSYSSAFALSPVFEATVSDDATSNRAANLQGTNDAANLTTSAIMTTWQLAGGSVDSTGVCALIHGDLA